MTRYFITFLLFFVPFIVIPFGHSQFESPKIIISEIAIDLLFVGMVIKQGSRFFSKLNRNQLIITGFLVLLTIYHILFLQTPFTFFGDPTRLQGIVLLWHLVLLSLIAPNISLPKLTPQWLIVIFLALFLLSLFIGNQNGRAVATFGEPNALASFIVFLWPFLYFSNVTSDRNRLIARIFSIFCTLAIIFLTGSRSGLIALAIQLLFLLLLTLKNLKLKPAIVITLFFILLTYTLPFVGSSLYENRADVWQTAIIAGMHLPILGGGFGNMEMLLNETTHELQNSLVGYSLDSAHNILLDWWVQGGFAGVSLLIMYLFIVFKNLYIHNRRFELLLLFGIITTMSFNPASIVTLIEFWWLIGSSFGKRDSILPVKNELNTYNFKYNFTFWL